MSLLALWQLDSSTQCEVSSITVMLPCLGFVPMGAATVAVSRLLNRGPHAGSIFCRAGGAWCTSILRMVTPLTVLQQSVATLASLTM